MRRRPVTTGPLVVEREPIGPTVVGGPRVVAALEQNVGRTVVANDENDITLPIRLIACRGKRRQSPKIDATRPVGGDRHRCARLPAALAQTVRSDGRDGLLTTLERTEHRHQAGAPRAVVAG